MARTTLVNLLRQAYRIGQCSIASQVPPDTGEAGVNVPLSRRQFMAGMAIAGLWVAQPQFRGRGAVAQLNNLELGHSGSRVLVVGAGIAGLTVAYRLQRAGLPVDVVEVSQRVGGRLRSVSNNPKLRQVVELGGEFIDSQHHAVRSLALELGLELADLRAADLGLEPEILYFQGQKISHSWVANEFVPLAQRIAQDLTRLKSWDLTYHNLTPAAIELDRLSLADYLDQTPIHPTIRDLVRVAYITEYGLDIERQSCLNLLFLIGAETGQWSAYGVSDERFHVVGGNDLIPRRLAERLTNSIELGTALEAIRATADDRYQVSLRSGATSRERIYDRVVLTVPFSVLRQVDMAVELPPAKQQAIAELGYGTSSKLAIPFQERIWRTRYGSTISIYTDQEFQNTWESARYSSGPSGWVTDLRGGSAGVNLSQGSAETHAKELIADLNVLFPGLDQVERGTAVRAAWIREPYALGSYSCYLPGQWTAFGSAEAERVGNLWFAGEHCSIGSQGYMNGACESAERVAQGILHEMGLMTA
ncbi:MAG: hypothetical protein Kow00121_17100 [Elainellaceae cyanobacterium]